MAVITQGAVSVDVAGCAAVLAAMDDASMERALSRALEIRRRRLGPDRDAIIAEIDLARRLHRAAQQQTNLLAERVYGGRHPKHWLWSSHKAFIVDRVCAGERVLDIGCGASAYLLWMAEKGAEVTACDMNAARIAQATAIMAHPRLRFEVRDVVRDPPSERYDVVICSHVIEHLDEPVEMLRALRACAPRLIVAVPPMDNRWEKVMYRDLGLLWKDDEDHRREYTPEMLREQVEAAGWRVVEMHAGVDIKAVAE